jgi:hypothetical protein
MRQRPKSEDIMSIEIEGAIQNVRNIETSTGRKMVTCTIDGYRCKAFSEIAMQVEKLEDCLVEVIAEQGGFQGAPEYLVTKVKPMLVGPPLKRDELKHERWRRRIGRACSVW